MQPTIEARAERLLAALAGVVSARAVADETGRLTEVHILATPELHPKQIVRNVESALSAGLGLHIDRRIVSVAQLRNAEASVGRPRTLADEARAAARRTQRIVYVQFETSSASTLDLNCLVTLRRGADRITGTGNGVNTVSGRASAAARAVFDALQRDGEQLGLEDTAIIETQGRSWVLVSARSVAGRTSRLLTGVALLRRSPEESAIMAALQATNRLATS